MELYFTRHGRTEWNQALRFQGREGDSPLLPESYREIEQLGKHLATIPFVRIYASPQKRAKETALGIQQHLKEPVEIIYSDDLREIGMGDLEGADIMEARKIYGETLDALRYSPDRYDPTPFGGEPYEEMLIRGQQLILSAAEQEQGPLLFVSHGATLTGCIQTLAGADLADVRKMGGLGNNTLSVLKMGESKALPFTLKLWNDDRHLQVNKGKPLL